MHLVTHPGPVDAERVQIAPCAGAPVELELSAGMTLDEAVAAAMAEAGLDSAWLTLEAAPVDSLDYVMPDLSTDGVHVAWYSKTHSLNGPGQIADLGMIVGHHDGNSFLHGHGRWAPDGGKTAMGHILPHLTVLSAPAVARGIGIKGASFQRGPDPETAFDLFHAVEGTGSDDPDHALLRLRPNQDFATALDAACAALGWQRAKAYGVGSLNHTVFEDGRFLDSLPTEFFVSGAEAVAAGGKGPGPDIAIVGLEGTGIFQGEIKRGENAVLITAEIVIARVE